jgi:hypothetical protein
MPAEAGSAGQGGAGGEDPATTPQSCSEVLLLEPGVASGPQLIDPDRLGGEEPFISYCDMLTDEGGWTLLGSFQPDSQLDTSGETALACFDEGCVNRAFARLPIKSDLRIDAADVSITGDNHEAMLIINRVNKDMRGLTLQSVMLGSVRTPLQADNYSQRIEFFRNDRHCGSWPDFGHAMCFDSTLVFHDLSACSPQYFTIGVELVSGEPYNNCDGWPQAPGQSFPHVLRFWTR